MLLNFLCGILLLKTVSFPSSKETTELQVLRLERHCTFSRVCWWAGTRSPHLLKVFVVGLPNRQPSPTWHTFSPQAQRCHDETTATPARPKEMKSSRRRNAPTASDLRQNPPAQSNPSAKTVAPNAPSRHGRMANRMTL